MSHTGRGFTLIEMLVVLSIMGILTVVVLTGQSTFNQSLLLNDTVYTLALSIREAQSLGLSSRKFSTIQNAGYGVHFATAQPDRYTIFADVNPLAGDPAGSLGGLCPGHTVLTGPEARPGNCIFDSSAETVQTYTFTRGFKVSNVCVQLSTGGSLMCGSSYPTSAFDIVFIRPNTQSILTASLNGTYYSLSKMVIHLTAPSGSVEHCVTVTSFGQVSVNQTCT